MSDSLFSEYNFTVVWTKRAIWGNWSALQFEILFTFTLFHKINLKKVGHNFLSLFWPPHSFLFPLSFLLILSFLLFLFPFWLPSSFFHTMHLYLHTMILLSGGSGSTVIDWWVSLFWKKIFTMPLILSMYYFFFFFDKFFL